MKSIRELREEAGQTQLQLAIGLGVTPATVYNWERGKFEPKASQLRAIARHFGVSMDEIDFETATEKKDATASNPRRRWQRPSSVGEERRGA